MEVYIDDMLAKSYAFKDHVNDLEKIFATLRRYQIKLNPPKYAFGVTSGKFLRFMVSHRKIETNLEKIQAMRQMVTPKIVKDVQRLMGSIAALN